MPQQSKNKHSKNKKCDKNKHSKAHKSKAIGQLANLDATSLLKFTLSLPVELTRLIWGYIYMYDEEPTCISSLFTHLELKARKQIPHCQCDDHNKYYIKNPDFPIKSMEEYKINHTNLSACSLKYGAHTCICEYNNIRKVNDSWRGYHNLPSDYIPKCKAYVHKCCCKQIYELIISEAKYGDSPKKCHASFNDNSMHDMEYYEKASRKQLIYYRDSDISHQRKQKHHKGAKATYGKQNRKKGADFKILTC